MKTTKFLLINCCYVHDYTVAYTGFYHGWGSTRHELSEVGVGIWEGQRAPRHHLDDVWGSAVGYDSTVFLTALDGVSWCILWAFCAANGGVG